MIPSAQRSNLALPLRVDPGVDIDVAKVHLTAGVSVAADEMMIELG